MTTIAQSPSSHPLPFTKRLMLALADIKLAHSVFALPFAILAAFLVAPYKGDAPAHGIDWTTLAGMLALVVVCMVFARSWAMLVNRVADAKLDAANPRTQRRAFASGNLSTRDGALLLTLCAVGFIAGASGFGLFYDNWIPLFLSIPVLLWIGFYSFTKRFTWLCHAFLGGALAASPIAAAIAVGPELLVHEPSIYALSAMVLFWVAGFDMIYALQDMEHDQSAGLSSIPSRFGWKRAIWIARAFHLISISALVLTWSLSTQLSTLFLIAIGLTTLLLIYEHHILSKRGKAGIPMAFFTLNGIISLLIGSLGILDVILR